MKKLLVKLTGLLLKKLFNLEKDAKATVLLCFSKQSFSDTYQIHKGEKVHPSLNTLVLPWRTRLLRNASMVHRRGREKINANVC